MSELDLTKNYTTFLEHFAPSAEPEDLLDFRSKIADSWKDMVESIRIVDPELHKLMESDTRLAERFQFMFANGWVRGNMAAAKDC